jgi:hypothetical protein
MTKNFHRCQQCVEYEKEHGAIQECDLCDIVDSDHNEHRYGGLS